MPDPGEDLITKLEATREWPPKWETSWGEIAGWAAFREGDHQTLKRMAGWDTAEHRSRNYIVDSMAGKISTTFAELIFGEDPDITAASTGDQDRLEEIIEENQLPTELQTAAELCSSEGEVWWRYRVDREQADLPILEWHSRLAVLPVLRGRKVQAAAMWQQIVPDPEKETVFRYFEVHAEGLVRNVLFKGIADRLGNRVQLDATQDTADLPEEWAHGLPILTGRIQNRMGRSRRAGVSDYRGVKDYLFALNEVATIGQENARLTLKKRVVVPERYLDISGNFPGGSDVIIAPSTDVDPDKPGEGLVQVEWSFDAQAFIAYKDEIERTILGRVGLAKQLVDAGNPTPEGRATGTALRLRLIPTVLATNGKARAWDDELPKVLMLGQMLDALEDASGGFGYHWATADQAPVIERTDPLPQDETEEATRHSLLVGAEIESRKTAIEELHPDWDQARVADEIAEIQKEARDMLPSVSTGDTGGHVPPITPPDGGAPQPG